MKNKSDEKKANNPIEGALVVSITKALFAREIDKVFGIIGGYLDENDLKVSAEMIAEYEKAGRITPRKIIQLPTNR